MQNIIIRKNLQVLPIGMRENEEISLSVLPDRNFFNVIVIPGGPMYVSSKVQNCGKNFLKKNYVEYHTYLCNIQ